MRADPAFPKHLLRRLREEICGQLVVNPLIQTVRMKCGEGVVSIGMWLVS
jgi:hypothetical protein